MKILLDECKGVRGSDASLTWVPDDFLLQEGVRAWGEMPLWMPEDAAPHFRGFMYTSTHRAAAAGLTLRALSETIRDTLTWYESDRATETLSAGIDPEKERLVLRNWHNQQR
jgi:2'-hydroxyisoflavone reductase